MYKLFSVFLGLSLVYFTWLYTTYQPIHDDWNNKYAHMTPAEFWNIGDSNG